MSTRLLRTDVAPRRRWTRWLAFVLSTLLAGLGLPAGAASPAAAGVHDVIVSSYPSPSGLFPGGVAVGPDGALWFTAAGVNGVSSAIGRITTSGAITYYNDSNLHPARGIVSGPDGALWFSNGDSIGRITTSGTITYYSDPHLPGGIVVGPDGALWFTNSSGPSYGGSIGRITTTGTITIFDLPAISYPQGIAAGPDGALWITNAGNNSIVRMTTSGKVTPYADPSIENPGGIAAGNDGALWFTNYGADSIGRITTAGVVTNYPDPASRYPLSIAPGFDGALWFSSQGNTSVGRITTDGTITHYDLGSDINPYGTVATVAGPDHAMWFTSYLAIERVTFAPPAVTNAGPNVGPDSGNTATTISGSGFTGASAVNFGPTPAASFTVDSDNQITATSPAHVAGTVDITVTTPAGTSATTGGDQFTFVAAGGCATGCVSIGDKVQLEGDSASHTMTFKVTLSQPATTTITVDYTVSSVTATGNTKRSPGADFRLKTGTLTFTPDRTSGKTGITKPIAVAVFADTTIEPDETFAVTLSNVTGGYSLGPAVGIGTILNDDPGRSGITLGVGDGLIVVQHRGSQSNPIPVTLSAMTRNTITVNYTITPGTATYSQKVTGGGDFGGTAAGTLTFLPGGATSKTITSPTWPDPGSQSDETYTVTLSGLGGDPSVTLIRDTGTGTLIGAP